MAAEGGETVCGIGDELIALYLQAGSELSPNVGRVVVGGVSGLVVGDGSLRFGERVRGATRSEGDLDRTGREEPAALL